MRRSVNVKLQTGFFRRTDCKLKTTAEGLTFTPTVEDAGKIFISAANIKSVTLYEEKLKMEISAESLTEVHFASSDDWLDTMRTLKENIDTKIVYEFN